MQLTNLPLRFLTTAILSSPLLAIAQEVAEETEVEEEMVYFTASDLPWLIGMLLVFVAILAFIGYKIHKGASQQFAEADTEAWQFERTLLAQVEPNPTGGETSKSKVTSALPLYASPSVEQPTNKTPDLPPAEPPEIVAAPVSDPVDSAPVGEMQANTPEETVTELAQRLQKLGILGDRQGIIAMPIPPDALIYGLRKGGTAVLLPRVESEAFLAHQAKRFDKVFAMTNGGEVLVFSRLQNQIPELSEQMK